MRHILLIGLGAIGSTVARALRKDAKRVRLSVLVRPGSAAGARAVKEGVAPEEVVDSLAKLREIPELDQSLGDPCPFIKILDFVMDQFHAAEGPQDFAPGDGDVLEADEVSEDDAVAKE